MSEGGAAAGAPSSPPPPEAGRVARGALWATIEVWGVELLQLLVFTALARLVGPEPFGLVALAMAFVLVPQNLLVHGGWIEALVQRPNLDREELYSVFWLLAGSGFGASLILALAAPLVGSLVGLEAIVPVLRVLAVCPFLTSLMVVPAGLLQRRLALAPLALRSILGVGLGGAVAIGLAIAGAGPWALVVFEIAWPLAGVVVLGFAAGHRPGWTFSWRRIRPIGRFVLGITGEQLLALAELLVPRLLLGALAGPSAVGNWGLARKLFDLSAELVARPALRVALPGFARLHEERERLSNGLALAVELTALAAVPGYGLALLLAPDLVALAFGEAWREAGEALRILALLGPVVPLGLLLGSAFQAAGRADLVLLPAAIGTVLLLLLLVPLTAHGVLGVAAAFTLRGWFLLPVRLELARRALGVAPLAVLAPLSPILAAGAALVVATAGVRILLPVPDPAGVAGIALAAAAGAGVYVGALVLLARPALRRAAAGLAGLRARPVVPAVRGSRPGPDS